MMQWHEFDGADGKIAIDMAKVTAVLELGDTTCEITGGGGVTYVVEATFRATMTILENVLEWSNRHCLRS